MGFWNSHRQGEDVFIPSPADVIDARRSRQLAKEIAEEALLHKWVDKKVVPAVNMSLSLVAADRPQLFPVDIKQLAPHNYGRTRVEANLGLDLDIDEYHDPSGVNVSTSDPRLWPELVGRYATNGYDVPCETVVSERGGVHFWHQIIKIIPVKD